MTESLSTKSVQTMLTYPFKDPNWAGKFFTAVGLTFAATVVPIVPALFVNGYVYRIMHNMIVDKEDPAMPEWTDWGKLLSEGWRLFAVSFLYQLPFILAAMIGFGFYFASFIGMAVSENSDPNSASGLLFIIPMAVLMVSMVATNLLLILTFCVLPAALGHTVARDSFSAGFDFTGWWKVMRANLGGFGVALLVLFGLVSVMYILSGFLYSTIVLICIIFIVPMVGMVYVQLAGAALIGQAYREGVLNLEINN